MKFFIIDGSGFLYRAYYAFPFMADKDGHNVNVVFGFYRMILKIFAEKPDYLVIARDSPVKTKRHELYTEYKANRKKIEDDFKYQIPITQNIATQLSIPNITIDTYEADDIIFTLAKQFKADQNMSIDIYSSDKDLKQLIDTNVYCIDPLKSIKSDSKSFLQEYMFEPQYIVDYLALTGDSADNIKGVPGIGPKKASDLIKKYKTIENIYNNIDSISGEVKEKLLHSREEAFHSKKLIELYNIDSLLADSISKYSFEIDFDKYRNVLVNDLNFSAFNKVLDDIKNKFYKPQQSSLF